VQAGYILLEVAGDGNEDDTEDREGITFPLNRTQITQIFMIGYLMMKASTIIKLLLNIMDQRKVAD
jgi:hypothetical protein